MYNDYETLIKLESKARQAEEKADKEKTDKAKGAAKTRRSLADSFRQVLKERGKKRDANTN